MAPEIGDKISFIPSAYNSQDNGTEKSREKQVKNTVKGTVISVNHEHRWYRVEYQTDYNGVQHECFKF